MKFLTDFIQVREFDEKLHFQIIGIRVYTQGQIINRRAPQRLWIQLQALEAQCLNILHWEGVFYFSEFSGMKLFFCTW